MAKGMNKKESELFKFIMARYKKQHDENDYYRRDHDEALEYYQSYKNPYDEPLAYNDSFNRILPIIYTYLQRYAHPVDLFYIQTRSVNEMCLKPSST